MAQWTKLLLGTSLFITMSVSAMAETAAPVSSAPSQPSPDAGNISVSAPSAEPAASETANAAAAEPSAAPMTECKDTGGLAAEPGALSAFYKPQTTTVSIGADALTLSPAQGAMVVNGMTYKLQSVEIPEQPAIAMDSKDYKMEIRFVHEAADGSKAVLSVPVSEGQANIGLEKVLGGGNVSFNPDEFLPRTRDYAPMGKTFGSDCTPQQTVQHYLMIHPVEVSSAQLERFRGLFTN